MGMREFQARMNALQKVEQATPNTVAQAAAVAEQGSNYAVLEIALQNDVNRIRTFPTLEQRAEEKRDRFLPKWLPFVRDYLEKGEIYQNDIFIYCIIYLFDVDDFDQALQLADKAIKQNQSMPEPFKTNLTTFVANQIYKWADKTAAAGQPVEPYFSQTFQNVATEWKLIEVIAAKWYKMAAALLIRNLDGQVKASGVNDPERLILAIQLCTKAFQLNPNCGVKTMVERCLMRLEALAEKGKYNPNSTEFPPVSGLSLDKVEINIDRVVEKLRSAPSSEDEEIRGNDV